MKQFGLSLAVALLISASIGGSAQAAQQGSNKVLVRWKGEQAIQTINVSNVSAVMALLQADQQVDHVEVDAPRSISTIPNDPYFSTQANVQAIEATTAWDTTTGSNQVAIAILDTGVDMDHPDLVGNIWTNMKEISGNGIDDDANGYIDDVHGWDFVENDADPSPTPTSVQYDSTVVIHGTHVAGLIGAVGNNGIGMSGLAWTVQIMPLRIFDDQGNSSISTVLDAIAYATANGAQVINMSYGGQTASEFESEAIAQATANGVLSLAAAGNEQMDLNIQPEYPACYNDVIGVGATDTAGNLASFSNYGSDCVDLAAPGESVLSTVYSSGTAPFSDEYGFLSGTSMSTPLVSGIAGLLLAIQPDFTPAQLTHFITASADDIALPQLGAGQANAAHALVQAIATLQPDPVVITAYTTAKQRIEIERNTRSADRTPYFSWRTPTSIDPIVGYAIQWGTTAQSTEAEIVITKPHYQPPAVDGNDTVYYLRVVAIDSQGRRSDSAAFRYRVDTGVAVPGALKSQLLINHVQLNWKPVTQDHVVSYLVYRSVHAQRSFRKMTKRLTTTSYTDTTALPGHTYYYKVRAIDDLGNMSSLSKAVRIKL